MFELSLWGLSLITIPKISKPVGQFVTVAGSVWTMYKNTE